MSRAPTPQRAWDTTASAGSDLSFGIGPAPTYGAQLSLQTERIEGLGPFIRFGAVLGSTGRTDAARAEVRFRAWAARLQVAPVRLHLWRSVLSLSCGMEAGQIHAQGFAGGLDTGFKARSLWLATQEAIHLRVPFSALFSAELVGGLVQPLNRVRYVLDAPHTVVHRTPALSAFVGLNLLWRLGQKKQSRGAFGDQRARLGPSLL